MRFQSRRSKTPLLISLYTILVMLGMIVCAASISGLLLDDLKRRAISSRLHSDTTLSREFRQLPVCEDLTARIRLHTSEDPLRDRSGSEVTPGEEAAIEMLESDFGQHDTGFLDSPDSFLTKKAFWEHHPDWDTYLNACKAIWDDVSCFPVAEVSGIQKWKVSFENSWMYERKYGGRRFHEGTDLFPARNEPGLYPVVSMTEGTVIQKGWLKLGGYRIGILAPGGAYFYYAHLDSYADLEIGDSVLAGQFLGYMGDTGYSEKEGTRGNFPVYLHVGIYLLTEEGEISVNPYPVLQYISTS